ncbi:unnamed protein product [Heterosigma akashiwo]
MSPGTTSTLGFVKPPTGSYQIGTHQHYRPNLISLRTKCTGTRFHRNSQLSAGWWRTEPSLIINNSSVGDFGALFGAAIFLYLCWSAVSLLLSVFRLADWRTPRGHDLYLNQKLPTRLVHPVTGETLLRDKNGEVVEETPLDDRGKWREEIYYGQLDADKKIAAMASGNDDDENNNK